jgi:hypothetical protein
MNKRIDYYLILFAILLFTFSYVLLLFEIIKYKITINIPYNSLILFLISFLIFLYVTIYKKYYIHLFFYLIGFISICIILFLKKIYDNDNKPNVKKK